jgi:hypothetical protein
MPRLINLALMFCVTTLLWNVDPFTSPVPRAEAQTVEVTQPERPSRPDDIFVRLFPGLPPFAPPTDDLREQVKKFGQKGGPLDATPCC